MLYDNGTSMDYLNDRLLWIVYIIAWMLTYFHLSGCLEIIETPSDTASIKGNDVVLVCTTSPSGQADYLEWVEFVSNPAGQRIWLSDDSPSNVSNPQKFAIEGTYNLRIKQVDLKDGGKYGCKLIVQHDAHYTAEVTVFEYADCTAMGEDLYEYDMAYISCNVPYGGTNPPSVHFFDTVTGEELQINYERGENYVYISANISATYEDDDKPYECRVTLRTPSYYDDCTAALNVSYSVRNITITPENSIYYIGERINCTSLGNPEPSIWWKKVTSSGGEDTIHGSILEIIPTMEGINTWKCFAENEVKDNVTTKEREISFTASTAATTPGDIVGSASIIGFALWCNLLVTTSCFI